MIPTLRYAWLTVQHKYFVFRAGLWTGAPFWRLVVHDWSKFLPSELPIYGRQFFGGGDDEFPVAWLRHQNRHPHHWEYWITRTSHNRATPEGITDNQGCLPMPLWAVREMVADWIGASRAYDGKWPYPSEVRWPWLTEHFAGMRLHPKTRNDVTFVISEWRQAVG